MTQTKKGLAIILAFAMLFCSLPFTIYAIGEGNNSAYTVETYFMDTEGKYSQTPSQSDIFTSEEGTYVSAETSAPEGFRFDTEGSIAEGIVTADNSLVLKNTISVNSIFSHIIMRILSAHK